MNNLKSELTYLLRNSDILTTDERGVTTTTASETINSTQAGEVYDEYEGALPIQIQDNAFFFPDGQDNYIDSGQKITTINSLSVWFKTDTGGTLLSQDNSPREIGHWDLACSSEAGWIIFSLSLGPTSTIQISKISNYRDNEWHNVIVTHSGSKVTLYVDGVQANYYPTSQELQGSNILNLRVGKKGGVSPGTTFIGSITGVQVYNREITEEEIAQIYAAGRNAYSQLNDALLLQYSGQDYTGTEEIVQGAKDVRQILIDRTNVKNIRSVSNGTELDIIDDYEYDLNYTDTTIKTEVKIYNTSVDGEHTITYDYGSDRIFPDLPRTDLKINSYPRISIEEISKSTEALSLGGKDFISSRIITIVVFSEKADFIEEKVEEIESLIRNNAKSLYYASFIRPLNRGTIIKHEGRSNTILQKNIDLLAQFEVEEAN